MSECGLVDGAFYPVRFNDDDRWSVAQYHAETEQRYEFFEACGLSSCFYRNDFAEIGERIVMPADEAGRVDLGAFTRDSERIRTSGEALAAFIRESVRLCEAFGQAVREALERPAAEKPERFEIVHLSGDWTPAVTSTSVPDLADDDDDQGDNAEWSTGDLDVEDCDNGVITVWLDGAGDYVELTPAQARTLAEKLARVAAEVEVRQRERPAAPIPAEPDMPACLDDHPIYGRKGQGR